MFSGDRNPGKENVGAIISQLEYQADIYRGLGVSKDAIMRLVAPRPDWLPKELQIPVVTLGTSVNLDRQAGFAGIEPYFDLSSAYDTAGGVTYGEPHLIWMSNGSENVGKSVEWVRAHYPRGARPSTLADGIALAIVNSHIHNILRDHAIDLPGSSVLSDTAPGLRDWIGGMALFHDLVGNATSSWGSALSGS